MHPRLIEKVTTAPTVEPVTAAEAKLHASVDGADWDSFFNEKIESARRMVEAASGRSLITRTYTGKMARFPYVSECGWDLSIYLPNPPAATVTSITYIATDGTSTVLSTDVYELDTYAEPGKVVLKYNQVWPDTRVQDAPTVTVVWTAGFGAAATAVPANYKTAISQLVGYWYLNREGEGTMPPHVEALCNIDRVMVFA